jgi:5-carboxymethyl-2-hydroxymuconate isomerase
MPHVIIEYSGNLDRRHGGPVAIEALVHAVHRAALGSGIAPLDALRTRAAPREHFAIADEHPDNGFIAVTARLGAGRADADKRALIEALMDALTEHLGDAQHDLMLSVEYQEIDPDFRLNLNHVRTRMNAPPVTSGSDTDVTGASGE